MCESDGLHVAYDLLLYHARAYAPACRSMHLVAVPSGLLELLYLHSILHQAHRHDAANHGSRCLGAAFLVCGESLVWVNAHELAHSDGGRIARRRKEVYLTTCAACGLYALEELRVRSRMLHAHACCH